MLHLKSAHRISFPLPTQKIEELEKNKETKIVLPARSHNYPIGTILKVSNKRFAIVKEKKTEILIGKNNNRELGYEYCLQTDK